MLADQTINQTTNQTTEQNLYRGFKIFVNIISWLIPISVKLFDIIFLLDYIKITEIFPYNNTTIFSVIFGIFIIKSKIYKSNKNQEKKEKKEFFNSKYTAQLNNISNDKYSIFYYIILGLFFISIIWLCHLIVFNIAYILPTPINYILIISYIGWI